MMQTYPTKQICGIAHIKRPCKACHMPVWFQANSRRDVCTSCDGTYGHEPRTISNNGHTAEYRRRDFLPSELAYHGT